MERHQVVQQLVRDERGTSLIEVMIAMLVLVVGLLPLVGITAVAVKRAGESSPMLIAREKAREAIESVHTARDTGQLTWQKIQNVGGGGVFLAGAQSIKVPGADGLVNTADDSSQPVEFVSLPGKDQTLGTADDGKIVYNSFTREIKITDITGTNGELRKIEVTVTYQNGPTKRTYLLTTYISAYS